MDGMFGEATAFDGDISKWDVSRVTDTRDTRTDEGQPRVAHWLLE
mgnify:CR=1 FL=1